MPPFGDGADILDDMDVGADGTELAHHVPAATLLERIRAATTNGASIEDIKNLLEEKSAGEVAEEPAAAAAPGLPFVGAPEIPVADADTTNRNIIPVSSLFRSAANSGGGTKTLKRLPGAPKAATTALSYYQKEKRAAVKEQNAGLPYGEITKILSAQWKELSPTQQQPYKDKNVGDKLRYNREMEEFKNKLGPEKVAELEEAKKVQEREQKRKRAIDKLDRDAWKRERIEELNKERFKAMAAEATIDRAKMFKATEGKATIAARPSEDMKPAYTLDEYVAVAEDFTPGNNRPYGKGRVVAARGTGTGTFVDVAYDKAYDDAPTVLPDDYPLKDWKELVASFGRVHCNIPFSAVTRTPDIIGRGDVPAPKRMRTEPKRLEQADPDKAAAPKEWDNPLDMIVARHKAAIKAKKPKGWRRAEVRAICEAKGEKVGKQMSIGEKNQFLNEYYLLKLYKDTQELARGRSGQFKKKSVGVKDPYSIWYLVQWAWHKGSGYPSQLQTQLRRIKDDSKEERELMDMMLQFPATDDFGERLHVSVIDDADVAKRYYTPARMYAIHTARPETFKGGKYEPTYEEGKKDAAYSTRISELMGSYVSLAPDDKLHWESKSREWLAYQPVVKYDIIEAMRQDHNRSWEKLEEDVAINGVPFCSGDTIRRWVQSREGYGVYCERIIPLLTNEQRRKHFLFATHFRNNWGLGPGKYLLIHYDEKWFWGLVMRAHAKMCAELGIEPTTHSCYHKNHINKCMAVAVTGFAFEDSIENGGDAIKIAFVRAQGHKIADRMVTSNTEVNPDGSKKVVRRRDDPWLVDCAITGSSNGTPDDPKYSLKDFFANTVFPIVEGMVGEGGKYRGYTPIFQGDNAGPHEEEEYLRFVTEYCAGKGWHWEPQAPQMPHMNVLDLSVFPCMSRRHSAAARKAKGKHVLSEDEIWETAMEVWDGLQSSKIASAYVQAHRIAGKVIEAEGDNTFLGVGGTPHVGIRKDFYPTDDGLKRKDRATIPAPPPAVAQD